jgi:transposase-like protein
MRIIKMKYHCSLCGNEYEHKANPDSRGFFEVPKFHCSKCLIEMEVIIDGVKKNPDGE